MEIASRSQVYAAVTALNTPPTELFENTFSSLKPENALLAGSNTPQSNMESTKDGKISRSKVNLESFIKVSNMVAD